MKSKVCYAQIEYGPVSFLGILAYDAGEYDAENAQRKHWGNGAKITGLTVGMANDLIKSQAWPIVAATLEEKPGPMRLSQLNFK